MKLKRILIISLIIVLLFSIAISPLAVSAALADDGQDVVTEQVEDNTLTETNGIEEVSEGFVGYLKERYGEDYQYYYDKIIENWGSVEAYLLSFGERLPEEHRTTWQNFVGWLTEYSAVWAPAFAVIALIIAAVIGKKQFNKLVDRIVNAKLQPIVGELNKQSSATVSIIHAQKALLGSGDRFADSVKELEESEKELKNG